MGFRELLSRVQGRFQDASSSRQATSSSSCSRQPKSITPRPALLAPYSWRAGPTFRNDVLDSGTFLWEDQTGEQFHILATWPDPEDQLDVAWAAEPELAIVDDSEEEIWGQGTEKEGADIPRGPLRLYDCDDMILKDQRTYLEETHGIVPPYLVVSQVWGEIKGFMTLSTVPWPIPISEEKKWHAIRDYCKKERVKWLWMDILCINQSRSWEAEAEKEDEIPKMSYYYRDATACLVVPQNYEVFSSAYSSVMEILSRVVDMGAAVEDHAEPIWDAIRKLEIVLDDAWFWRVWTYQELLLPRKLVLLDGQELSVDGLERCMGWYYRVLRVGVLKKPKGGKEYGFVQTGSVGFDKSWEKLKAGWSLRTTFQQDGCLDLLPAVRAISSKQCRYPVDQMLGIYGLLKEEDRLPTLHDPETQVTTMSSRSSSILDTLPDRVASGGSPDELSAHLSPTRQTARLGWLWERTMIKTVTRGRVWPLLYDAMIADAPKGTNWIPRIVSATGCEVHEVWNQRNQRGVTVSEAGVHLTARVVGRISGASASIGDGTGELNKMIACAWALVAKGFDPQPILNLLEDGLAHSDTVLQDVIKDAQTQLRQALHAPSLAHCFFIVEKMDFRRKLVYGRDIAGWNRAVFTAQPGQSYSSADGTYVFLGWIYGAKTPDSSQCWILDVTAGSPDARRWVIANKTGPNTFHKIGSVATNTLPGFTTNCVYKRVILD